MAPDPPSDAIVDAARSGTFNLPPSMTKKRTGPMTAEELLRELEADPEWVAARDKREQELLRRQAELRLVEAPLLEALRAAGHPVGSVWDLVNTAAPYPSALPILLDHFTRPYPAVIREGIARALAVREARFAWATLKQHYLDERDEAPKDGLAAALSAIADARLVPDVIALVRDVRNGTSRVLLLRALTRSKDRKAHDAIRELATDPDLEKEIAVILRRKDRRRSSTSP